MYYFKEKHEVDFYAKLPDKEILIHVSSDITNASTQEREINGLVEAMNYFMVNESFLITRDEEQTLTVDGKKIHTIPLYRFLLEKNF